MTETWNGVKVKTQLLTKGTRRYGEKLRKGHPEFLVAHDTGNPNTTVQQNVDYYENTYNIDWDHVASAHIFVDDKEAIVCIPTTEKAWHVLYNATTDNEWYGVDANDGAVGVEISYFNDKKRSQKSLDNGARVLAYLAEYWKIDYKTRMPGHQDIQDDKQDPGNLLEAAGYSRSTANLDKIVAKYYKKDTKQIPQLQVEWKWAGTFVPNTPIKVRTAPSMKGSIVSNDVMKYTGVKVIKFNSIVKEDGYWWISYTSKGKKYYSAICKITDKKERVKHEKYWGKLKWKKEDK
ncbi:N-acetylmuramoyl-L-alanine amidase [Staphylococcus sp. 18_1_E_LY]|uniref:N-acetylmuramoyl-L-alanine amidase n=1 Tax=Staphylococcus lloydii TaxID=2781774 RepID=A0A7T1AYR7_9STAP|nr:peptidoglycan recognition family protein [Staphylococcus lloydii]MBF7019198.1 N-acetylmuramoyl-L-alanine amidase [Staphylococcus lloydii]MBF7026926.1 N-acetylmuramoyl-L-alanine amidase [Staphylococcus lloydii]QPM74576.1 N-acetylmuramoyl-L-alanine amidase [Staphylococcus lloydii]